MNDKPTSTEMVFGGFLLVFGIIAGIGIEKQILSIKPPKVIQGYAYDWKTVVVDRVEGAWFTNRAENAALGLNTNIVYPEPKVQYTIQPIELVWEKDKLRMLMDLKTGFLWVWDGTNWISTNRVNVPAGKYLEIPSNDP